MRCRELTDKAWQWIEPLLPTTDGRGRPWRNLVERCFGKLKQWRAVATRFDKLAGRYLAGAVIASPMLWLRHAELSVTA
ncbi:hypothetical protein [Streptosporangium sandarakinum]|uniref:hypothetical protein n=1 Tax=Streptosporangium sandarakinum TaxID=1260955 RepID=UPI003722169C